MVRNFWYGLFAAVLTAEFHRKVGSSGRRTLLRPRINEGLRDLMGPCRN